MREIKFHYVHSHTIRSSLLILLMIFGSSCSFRMSSKPSSTPASVQSPEATATPTDTPTPTPTATPSATPSEPTEIVLKSPLASPGVNSTPTFRISGVVDGNTVSLYTTSDCSGTPKASDTASDTVIDLTSSALTKATYTFYASTTDTDGNVSSCSTAQVEYIYGTGHVYVANMYENNLTYYNMEEDGTLDVAAGSPFVVGNGPIQLAVTPDNSYLYAANAYENTISMMNVAADGSLSANGSPNTVTADQFNSLPTEGASMSDMTIEPTGKSLYLGLGDRDGTISRFSIDVSGNLSQTDRITPFGLNSNTFPTFIIDGLGRFFYTAKKQGSTLYSYTLGALGALSTLGTDSLVHNTDNTYLYMDPYAVDRAGKYLYVANSNIDHTIEMMAIANDGSLSDIAAPIDNSVLSLGMVIDPTGKFLYSLNGDNTISTYTIGVDGSLSSNGSPVSANLGGSNVWAIAMDPSGSFIYVTASYLDGAHTGFVWMYRIAEDGTLSAIGTPNRVDSGVFPQGIKVLIK